MYTYMSISKNPEILDSYKSSDEIPLKCSFCSITHYKTKHRINQQIKRNPNIKNTYCSSSCRTKNSYKFKLVKCIKCNIFFPKLLWRINKSTKHYCSKECVGKSFSIKCDNCNKDMWKSGYVVNNYSHHFCSQSCSTIYLNKHKTWGCRRSKIEIWLEEQLIKIYPNLTFEFNNRKILRGLELDIYMPSINIAFEINGIHHYKEIYKKSPLNKIQERDKIKSILCEKNNIKLFTIDVSKQNRFSIESSKIFLNEIMEHISFMLPN